MTRPAVAVVTRAAVPGLDGAAARVADGGRRTANAGAVLRTVLDHGPIARSTIARITGLSPASVSGHCADLVRRGLLRESSGRVRSNGAGRPHIPVEIDATRRFAVAVHIGVHLTTTALVDPRGRILARRRTGHASADPERILRQTAQDIRGLCHEHAGAARALGVGVATGGWVDPDSGIVRDHPRLGWSLVPVRDRLSELTGLPVRVDGHSRALLNAEVLLGRYRGAGSVLHLFVGNVVDAAFATRGEAHYGARAQAGAIAHLPVDGSGEQCGCGRTGCLEATVSEQTLARLAHERGVIAAPEFSLLFEAACAGEDRAVALFAERARRVGRAAALLTDVFGPELVVVTEPGLARLPAALAALRGAARENIRTVCDVDAILVPTSFPGAVLETAGAGVLLDALYRDPLSFPARAGINSEDCNVDGAGPRR